MEIIQLSLCRWLCIQFTSHNQALFNPSLSGLELLKPIINSYFLFKNLIVACLFFFFSFLSFPVQKQVYKCKATWSHQATDICFPVLSTGLAGSNTTCLNHKNFN